MRAGVFGDRDPPDPALGPEGHSLPADPICLSVCLSLSTQQKNVSWAPGAAGAPACTTGRRVARPGAWRPGCGRPAGPGGRRRQPARCCPSQGNVPSRGPAQQVSPRRHSGLQQAGPPPGDAGGLGTSPTQTAPVRRPESPRLTIPPLGAPRGPALPGVLSKAGFPGGGQSQLQDGYAPAFIRTSLPFQNDRLPCNNKDFGAPSLRLQSSWITLSPCTGH